MIANGMIANGMIANGMIANINGMIVTGMIMHKHIISGITDAEQTRFVSIIQSPRPTCRNINSIFLFPGAMRYPSNYSVLQLEQVHLNTLVKISCKIFLEKLLGSCMIPKWDLVWFWNQDPV